MEPQSDKPRAGEPKSSAVTTGEKAGVRKEFETEPTFPTRPMRGGSGGADLPPPPPDRKVTVTPEYDSRTTIFLERPLGSPLLRTAGKIVARDIEGSRRTMRDDITLPDEGHLVRVRGPFRHVPGAELKFVVGVSDKVVFEGILAQKVELPRSEEAFLWLGKNFVVYAVTVPQFLGHLAVQEAPPNH